MEKEYAKLVKLIKLIRSKNLTQCKFERCDSSNILAYGYDGQLWIIFKNYKLYGYKGVTLEQFKDLQEAPSKGKWVNANLIKTKVEFDRYLIVGL